MEQQWYLSAVDILATLPEKERVFFLEKAVKKSFEKNAVIFSPGDPGTHIYHVLSGRVKIYNLAREGREVIYWFCTPKDFFWTCGTVRRRPTDGICRSGRKY